MDLRSLVADLMGKIGECVKAEVLYDSPQDARLRGELRTAAMNIVRAIDGPEQTMRIITRGVRDVESCTC